MKKIISVILTMVLAAALIPQAIAAKYGLSENFDYSVGTDIDKLNGWNIYDPGSNMYSKVAEDPLNKSNKTLRFHRDANGYEGRGFAQKSFDAVDGRIVANMRILAANSGSGSAADANRGAVYIYESNPDAPFVQVEFRYAWRGASFQLLLNGKAYTQIAPAVDNWFDLKIEADTKTQTYYAYINGQKVNEEATPFIREAHSAGGIRLGSVKGEGAGTVNDIYFDDINVASITKEEEDLAAVRLDSFAVENLVLPTIGGVNATPILWTSGDESVISASGVVTRGITDKTVTLTATAGEISKSFRVCVLADCDAAAAEGFDALLPGSINGQGGWTLDNLIPQTTANVVTENENQLLHIQMTQADLGGVHVKKSFNKVSGLMTAEMKLKYHAADANKLRFEVELIDSSSVAQTLAFQYDGTANAIYYKGGNRIRPAMPAGDEWFNLKFAIDTDAHTFDIYNGDTKLNSTPLAFDPSDVSAVRFYIHRQSGYTKPTADLFVDDIIVRNLSEGSIIEQAMNGVAVSAFTSEDIVLPASVSDVKIDWTSDDESVITSGGKITQTENEDKTAVLTAVYKYGAKSIEKKYNVTVIKAGKLGAGDRFEYEQPDETDINGISGWTMGRADDVKAYLDTEGGSRVLHIDRNRAGDDSYSVFAQKTFGGVKDVVSAQMRLMAGTKNMRFNTDILCNIGGSVYNGPEIGIDLANGVIESAAYTNSASVKNTVLYQGKLPEPGEWFDFEVTMYVPDQTFDIYINGEKLNKVPANFRTKMQGIGAADSICGIKFSINRYSQFTPGQADLYIDDVLVRSIASDAAAVQMAQSCINVNGNNVVADLELPTSFYGAQITWSSSDEQTISASGAVSRPIGFKDKSVVLTADITKGNASAKKQITANVPAIPEWVISKVHFADASGDESETLPIIGKVSGVTLLKNTPAEEEVLVIAAVYSGNMLECVQTATASQSGTIDFDAPLTAKTKNARVKIMVWNKAENMRPSAYCVDTGEREYVNIYTAGDSTVCQYGEAEFPLSGWGMYLNGIFDSSVVVVDNSQPGNEKSAKSFIDNGGLDYIAEHIESGDYLFIQFGHDDMRAERDDLYTDPSEGGSYEKYIEKYIDTARAAGAVPVLVTPMVKYTFDADGRVNNTLKPYAEAMKRVGAAKGAEVLDINALTEEAINAEAESYSGFYMENDESHLTEAGARWICGLIKSELEANNSPLAGVFAE